MNTYKRKLHLGEVVELAGLLKDNLNVSGTDRVIISKMKNKLAEKFAKEQAGFNERLQEVTENIKPGQTIAVEFNEAERKKKELEFTGAELSALGRVFVSIINDKEKGTQETVAAIMRLSSNACFMFEQYISDNFNEEETELIPQKEDHNLIPEA